MSSHHFENTKYDIPLNHLDYSYVQQCKDSKELEKILKILRSGIEGSYPDLEKTTEARLKELKPHSKLLQPKVGFAPKAEDLDDDASRQLLDDLEKWSESAKKTSLQSDLTSSANDSSIPPVRSGMNISTSKKEALNSVPSMGSKGGQEVTNKKPKSVKPRDYREWDKVDVDAELAKLEAEECKENGGKKVTANKQAGGANINRSSKLSSIIDTTGVDEREKEKRAEAEKNKGNEAFKAGDYDEAIIYYGRSLAWQINVAAYNNRAQTYLKLKKWSEAISDCNKVLSLEPTNVKGKLRRASAHIGRGEHMQALSDVSDVLDIEPQNKQAQEMKGDIDKVLQEQKVKGRRMVIEDVDGSSEDSEEEGKQHMENSNLVESNSQSEKIELANGAENSSKTDQASMSKSQKKRRKRKSKQKVKQRQQLPDCGSSSEASAESVNDDADEDASFKKSFGGLPELKSVNTFGALEQDDDGSLSHESTNDNSPGSSGPTEQSLSRGSSISDRSSVDTPTAAFESGLQLNTQNNVQNQDVKSAAVSEPSNKGTTDVVLELPADVSVLKDRGSQLFKSGQYGAANEAYSLAIETLLLQRDRYEMAICTLLGNRASCYLKTGDCHACIKDCNMILQSQPISDRALLKRASAYEQLEKYILAYQDYQAVLSITTSLPAHQGLSRCMAALQRDYGNKWREKLAQNTNQTTVSNSQDANCVQQNSDTGKKDSQKSDVTASQADKKELFNKWKEEGNSHVKLGNYDAAEQCYSRCVSLCPGEMAALTNRALCYLKLNQPNNALSDCSRVLSVDSVNVKALYRRALAYKMLGQFEDSLKDLRRVISLEPTNSVARKEIDSINVLWTTAREQSMKNKFESKRHKVVIEQTDSSSTDDDEDTSEPVIRNSFVTSKNKSYSPATKSDEKTQIKNSVNKREASINASNSSNVPFAASVNVTGVTNQIPSWLTSTKPLTAYEFTQIWLSLKHCQKIDQYAALLERIEPADLPNMISNKLDSPMLHILLECIHLFVNLGKSKLALEFLTSLPKVSRFQTIAMFLEKSEKEALKNTYEQLLSNNQLSENDVSKLKSVKTTFGLN